MLIKKYEDLLEDYTEDNFAGTVAEFLMNSLDIHQKVALKFNNQKYLESFFEKNPAKNTTISQEHPEIAKEKSRAERTNEILQRESPKRGYYVEYVFHDEDCIIYERFTIQ